ncbi:phage tail assembly protein [Collimonas antrihumi]|uniref:phage tail assembly protein n=1 Tax=Collimonas antrihumi TaxID=1940615 RepID=UPI001B8AD822|nr:phage tail assembly protein [Collimonas antrihumi]
MNDSIFILQLLDGLPSNVGGKPVKYKTVHLRETNVNDELTAVQLAERIKTINGKPTLLVSDDLYRTALTMRHVEKFTCSGLDDIGQDVLDLEMFGRLTTYDLQRIEERCLVVSMAAQLRYGLITEAEFDQIFAGTTNTTTGQIGPRAEGQAAAVGADRDQDQPGPAMLTDFTATNT